MTGSASLVDIIHSHLASDQLQLPVFHPIALQLQSMVAQENCHIQRVATLIAEDQALTSQTLRMANSPFFNGLSKVSTIRDAIVRLGFKQITNLIMLATQQQNYHSTNKIINTYITTLWKHAVGCAMGTKWLAERAGYASLAHEAFLAGLLHDIGKLFILKIFEDIHTSGKYDISLSKALFLEVMESMHMEQGYLLLQQWNLPELYCEVVRDHHKETYDSNNALLTMVRLVDLACHKLGIGMLHDPVLVLAASSEAQALGVSEILLAELEIKLEDAMELAR